MPYGYKQPSNWGAIRAQVMARDDYICHVCHQPEANEVDHVIPVAEGGTHDEDNLAPIHKDPCHRAKTQAERARGYARRKPRNKSTRKPEAHPGTITKKELRTTE